MRRKLVAGNWKMHGSLVTNSALLALLKQLHQRADCVEMAVCVPYPYLAQVSQQLMETGIAWGAQDVSEHDSGAYTGEVSGPMLAEFGCRFVLVGHSERRVFHGETDRQIAGKFAAAQRAGIIPVVCVGETLEQRDSDETYAVLRRQLEVVLEVNGVAALRNAVLAYEPVWAIGTGRTASPAQVQAVHEYLRGLVAARAPEVALELTLVYGGSVKPGNAGELFAMPDVDGGLIGGASLVAEDFAAIIAAAVGKKQR